ncbi:MAG TPA: TadG family pilus assembly protein [Methylomirabilota bacterium]|nr:TadG family pilus assembly protein [Methylomirabilota bacterium]
MISKLFREQQGTVLILTLILFLVIIAMGGLAIDTVHLIAVRGELQKSMDSASLAGAGNLGFNDSAFPTARLAAQQYGALNPWHGGPVNLNLNTANDPSGEIVLGIFDATDQTFTPSLDGTMVNAVRCRYATPVQNYFMGLLGFPTATVSAEAIAISNPPLTPPPSTCLFPIGVGSCPFQGASSAGCGVPITFITSSGTGDTGAGCLAPPCTNTAGWVSLDPNSSPNAGYLQNAILGAASGNCSTSTLQTGNSLETNNGMIQSVMNTMESVFKQQWEQSESYEVKNASNEVVYSGKGWKVYIPVIQTECPTGAISGSHTIVGWTELVIAQVINQGNCAVNNPWSPNGWTDVGQTNGCTGANAPENAGALRAIFGYFSCTLYPANPVPTPLPRSALASRLRLVR